LTRRAICQAFARHPLPVCVRGQAADAGEGRNSPASLLWERAGGARGKTLFAALVTRGSGCRDRLEHREISTLTRASRLLQNKYKSRAARPLPQKERARCDHKRHASRYGCEEGAAERFLSRRDLSGKAGSGLGRSFSEFMKSADFCFSVSLTRRRCLA